MITSGRAPVGCATAMTTTMIRSNSRSSRTVAASAFISVRQLRSARPATNSQSRTTAARTYGHMACVRAVESDLLGLVLRACDDNCSLMFDEHAHAHAHIAAETETHAETYKIPLTTRRY